MLACEKFSLVAGTRYRLSAAVPATLSAPVHLQLAAALQVGEICNTLYGPVSDVPSAIQCDFLAPTAATINAGVESFYPYSGSFALALTALPSAEPLFVSESRRDIVANTDYKGTVSHNVAAGGIESTYEFATPSAITAYSVIYSSYSNVAPMEVSTGGARACDPKQGDVKYGTDSVSGQSGYICNLHANGPIVVRISLDDDKYSESLFMPAIAAGGASYTLRIVPQSQP